MNNDIRNLSKWLNEEQETPIDRQALARVLAMAEQPQGVKFNEGMWQEREARIAQLEAELMRMKGRELKLQFALAKQPAQGCDYCNHHQYAGTKCKNCGRLAEKQAPAQQCMEHGECFGGECIYPDTQPAQQQVAVTLDSFNSQLATVLSQTGVTQAHVDHVELFNQSGSKITIKNGTFKPPQSAHQEPVAHCEAGPEHCPVCLAETRSLALAAAVGYIQRNTPKLVSEEICRALKKASPPAQRKPLTDEQWQSIADTLGCIITRSQKDAIEATIGIKGDA